MSEEIGKIGRLARLAVRALRSRRRAATMRARLDGALAELPAIPSLIYRLHCVDGLALSAIARQLDIEMQDVEAHLIEALVRLAYVDRLDHVSDASSDATLSTSARPDIDS